MAGPSPKDAPPCCPKGSCDADEEVIPMLANEAIGEVDGGISGVDVGVEERHGWAPTKISAHLLRYYSMG